MKADLFDESGKKKLATYEICNVKTHIYNVYLHLPQLAVFTVKLS